jgi:hypothetical protein
MTGPFFSEASGATKHNGERRYARNSKAAPNASRNIFGLPEHSPCRRV